MYAHQIHHAQEINFARNERILVRAVSDPP